MNILFKNSMSDHLFLELKLKYKHERKPKKLAYFHFIFLNTMRSVGLS